MKENLTDALIEHLYRLKEATIPDRVLEQAKMCLLDYIGVTIAGAKMLEERNQQLLHFLNKEQGSSTIVGMARKTTLQNAVFINGMNAHAAELDDGTRHGNFHPGSPIISALLPMAQYNEISGLDFLYALILGYEASIRLAVAIQPSHKQLGYHATGTCGTIGAAIASAICLGLNKEQLKHTISAAATGSAGLLGIIDDSSELKPYNAGRAALDGVMAAIAAQSGFVGPLDIIGGKRGFLSTMSKQVNYAALMPDSHGDYAIENIYRKIHAACRHCHPVIEAALEIRAKNMIHHQDIKKIRIHTYQLAVEGHDHTEIHGVHSAKMSIPYSAAVALVVGKAGIGQFQPQYISDPAIAQLTQKVEVQADDELSAVVPEKRPAIVEIENYEGQCLTERIDLPKGEPEYPLTKDDVTEKFISLAEYAGKTQQEMERIISAVWQIEQDPGQLYSLL